MASFMDYYQDELRKQQARTTPKPQAPKTPVKTVQELNQASKPDEGVFSTSNPIGWALDMLARPTYGMTNANRENVDRMSRGAQQIQQGDVVGGIGNVLSGAPTMPPFLAPGGSPALDIFKLLSGNNATQKFVEGATSNDREMKQANADLIEYATDSFGNRLAPGQYQDEQDNVNPWVKGIGGFALDVAGDPLTWLPGAAIAAAGRPLARAAKGASQAVKASREAKATEAVSDVVEAVAPAASRVESAVPAVDNVFEDAANGLQPRPAATPTATAIADEVPVPEPTPIPTPDLAAPEAVEAATGLKSLSQAIKDSPKVSGMRSEIKAIFDDLKPGATPNAEVSFKDWLTGPEGNKAVYVTLPGAGQARDYSMKELAKIASIKDPAVAQRAQAARALVQGSFDEFRQTRVSAVSNAVESFGRRMANGEKALRATLGEDLVDLLSGVTSPATMTKTLNMLDRILAGSVDVERFGSGGASQQRLLDTISRALGDEAGPVPSRPVAEPAPGTEALPPSTPPAQQAAELSETSEVFRQTVRQEMLPGTPEFNAKYAEFAKGNPLSFTAKEIDQRLGRWWRKANSFFQYTLYAKLWENVIKSRVVQNTAQEVGELQGKLNARAVREAILSTGDDITRAMETFGAPLHIGVDDRLVKLTFPQVYGQLDRVMVDVLGDDAALLALHNGGTRVAFTRLMEAVHLSITEPATTADDIAQLLRSPLKQGPRGQKPGGRLPNNITASYKGGSGVGSGAGKGWYTPSKKITPQMEELADTLGARWVKGDKQGYQLAFTKGGNLPELLADSIIAARGPLSELAAKNAEDWAARGIAEATEISGQALRQLRMFANDPSKAAQRELAAQVRNMPKTVSDTAADIAATPEGTMAAQVSTRTAMGERAVKDAEAIDTQALDIHQGVEPRVAADKRVDKQLAAIEAEDPRTMLDYDVGRALADETANDIDNVIPDNTPKLDLANKDLASVYELREGLLGGVGRSLGIRMKWNHQIPKMGYEAQGIGVTASRFVTDGIVDPTRALARAYSPEVLVQAFKAVQQGTKLPAGSQTASAARDVEAIVSKLFDLENTKVSALGNVFTDTKVNIEHVNEMLRWAMGSRALEFDVQAARTNAREALGAQAKNKALFQERVEHELKEQWRGWNIGDDVPGALVAMGQAAARVAEQRAIAASFARVGKREGWIAQVPEGEAVPAGFVKIVDSGGSTFARLLPKNTYMQRELAKELHVLDYLSTTSRVLSGELGDLVRSTIIPVTNSWKRLMTVMRPGHHIRNGIGNLSIQWVARGNRDMQKSWKATLKLMGVRNDFEGLDALEALRGMGDEVVPTGGDVLVSGRYGEITQDELWRVLNREGLLPTYNASEGLLDEEVLRGGMVARAASAVSLENTKAGQLAGRVSQGLDHYQRAHHFMQIIMQESAKRGRWDAKSKQELYRLASTEVKRSHPDASMLAPFETKVMKLAIPFYTWLRGIMPFAIESAIQHPGRIATMSKASYNLAVANGVNPDSLGDPFPQDQLFPSFLREAAFGPQMQFGDTYIRMNPGIAHFDIAQSFGADPVRGLLGMTNPLFRVPAEVAAGGSWSTGGRINDTGDYIDQTLPGVNYLANLTGISPTGSIESILSGGGLDPQYQVARGNKDDWDKLISGINWLTGIGVQDLSRPNYINYAEIERRNAAGGR